MATREQIFEALLAALATTAAFKLVSRRDRAPDSVGPGQSPALFLIESGEKYDRPSPSLPPKRTLYVDAIFYNDVGAAPNAIPLTVVNAALDALDAALQPTSPTGFFTLGGFAYAVFVDGEVKKSTGAMTGKAGAVVPISILLP
jgi:hypothetical protein